MATQLSIDTTKSSVFPGRAQQIWLVTMQIVQLGLLALALRWSVALDSPHEPPAAIYQKLLIVLALGMLVVALVPNWRRGEIAGLLGGVILAAACWLSAGHVLTSAFAQKFISSTDVPTLTPIMIMIAALAIISGLLVRVGIFGESRVGIGALAGGLLLIGWTAFFYGLLHKIPAFKLPELGYGFSPDQLQEILAAIILFSLALWSGGVGIRRQGRWVFQPIGMVVVLAVFLLHWHHLR